MREWRKTHPLTPDQRVKDRARSLANVYKKRGKIAPAKCAFQGCNQPTQMHHLDYENPLNVLWICRDHHLDLHQVPE